MRDPFLHNIEAHAIQLQRQAHSSHLSGDPSSHSLQTTGQENGSSTILRQSGVHQSLKMSLQAVLVKIKQTEESLRRVNKKPTFSLFGARNAANEERDDERVRAQMMLDVEALGDGARAVGFGLAEVVGESQAYQELKRVAALGEIDPATPA
ncbi:hypothetical protein CTheo_572 [Ceratobasidium theobromae]|uniref:COG complex component COG2 C-terminal domain-containing protein n=1 Tax=Ceratobasidium theobromae TaxID=1582974 RepID=A0A5N5QWE2_9AGAM|nr:hypothetical protein CTheo_572 [Ceratobasidium theobromae]